MERIWVEKIGDFNVKNSKKNNHPYVTYNQNEETKKKLSEINTGIKNPRNKLSEEDIYFIKFVPNYRDRYINTSISKLFSIDRAYTWRIINERWPWINENTFDKKEIIEKTIEKMKDIQIIHRNKIITIFDVIPTELKEKD